MLPRCRGPRHRWAAVSENSCLLLGMFVKGRHRRISKNINYFLFICTNQCRIVCTVFLDRASELKTAIRSKNQTLKHLNQVLNICFLLTAGSLDKPIRCHGVTGWRRLLREDSLELTCVLENSSPFAFEQGWTLSITMFLPSGPPSRGGGNTSQSFSFPFHSVQPGETFEVVLPLAAAGDSSFPVTVSCSLVFSLLGLLAAEAALDLPDSQRSFALPLNTLTVDWLHALQVGGDGTAAHRAASQCGDSRMEAVRAFLSSRRTGWEEGESLALGPGPEQFSASVRLSAELAGSALTWDRRGEKSARRDISGPLLDWLLATGCGGVRPGHHRGQADGSVLRAHCPNGHPVKLSATEVKNKQTNQQKPWDLVEIGALAVLIRTQRVVFIGRWMRRGRSL